MVGTKDSQLQVRVSAAQKREIKRRARAAGVSVSAWVLKALLPDQEQVFAELCGEPRRSDEPSYALAAISDFLNGLATAELSAAVAREPGGLSEFHYAYVSAMVEHAAMQRGARVPAWVLRAPALSEPYFASSLVNLRLYLLTSSPPAFRRRNLFVDASVGERV